MNNNYCEHQKVDNTAHDGNRMLGFLNSLMTVCPICGKEFACNKRFHIYKSTQNRRRVYYCSYSCHRKALELKAKKK